MSLYLNGTKKRNKMKTEVKYRYRVEREREKETSISATYVFYGHFSFLPFNLVSRPAGRQALQLHLHVFHLKNKMHVCMCCCIYIPRYVVCCKHAYNFYRYMISLLLFALFYFQERKKRSCCEAGCGDVYIPVFIHFHTQAILYD